jgi:hypothetical protein
MHPRTVAVPALTALLLIGTWTSATAGGSDADPPYDVTRTALVLPAGDELGAYDHVNVTFDVADRVGSANLHIEPGTSTSRFIGRSSVTWVEVGVPQGACITWVQVSGYDEHYGEGDQAPVCTTGPTPSPEPSAPPTPRPQPSHSPDCTPSPEPSPTTTPYLPPPPRDDDPVPTPSDSPSDGPSASPSPSSTPTAPAAEPEPTDAPTAAPSAPAPGDGETGSPTPTAAPSPSDDADVLGPTPAPSESVDSEVLADGPDGTGDDTLATTGGSPAPGLALGIGALALGAGFVAMRARGRHRPAHRREA